MALMTDTPNTVTMVAGAWLNPSGFMIKGDSAYAEANPTKGSTVSADLSNFGFEALPLNAVINSVTATVCWNVSTQSSVATLGLLPIVNGVSGTELVNTAEPPFDTVQSIAVPATDRASLLNGNLAIRVRATRGNSNTAFTAYVEYVTVTVNYTVPSVSPNIISATWVPALPVDINGAVLLQLEVTES